MNIRFPYIISLKKIILLLFGIICSLISLHAQLNTERVMNIGRNALYFEDYILSIQYFNQVIKVKPYMAEPYFYRAAAKLSLEDFSGAEEDCNLCIERNPFITGAYQVRGIARQNLGDYQGAIDDYNEGLKYAPEDRVFLGNKAIAEVQLKKYDDAEKSFEKLIETHPSYYNGYLSRSQFWLERKDTLKAIQDIDKAISLDKHLSYAYAQRAIIKFQYTKDYQDALNDMNEALRLDPNMSAYYINRALIKYHLDDLRGTMADYDRVIEIDPNNLMAHYNRGLLRAQVGERNKAIEDFAFVLKYEPDNYFAYYNRAVLYDELGNYRAAIKDYDKVLDQYPDFYSGYYARSEAKRKSGDISGGKSDYQKAINLYEQQKKQRNTNDNDTELADNIASENNETDKDPEKVRKESDKNINKFDRLLVADNTDMKSKYTNEIRGRVQDKNFNIEIAPAFVLSYYEKPDQLKPTVSFVAEVENLNRAKILPYKVLLTNAELALDSAKINKHFVSINDYSKLIEINPRNAVPYFGRAIDFMLIQDFASSLDDLNRVIQLSDNFVLAYFMRAVVRFKQIEYETYTKDFDSPNNRTFPEAFGMSKKTSSSILSSNLSPDKNKSFGIDYEMVLRDYDKVIELAPQFVYAYYNRANVRCAQKDFKAALADYNEAIRLRPDFSDAYFNRGLVYVFLGETQKGIADLSKAGELGIVSAYNVIKRLSD